MVRGASSSASAHPAVSRPLLKELRLEPPGTVPKSAFFWLLFTAGGVTKSLRKEERYGWILPQFPRDATTVRQSLALPGALEEGWSWR